MTTPTDPLADRLEKCYAAAVHDVLRGMGHERCVLPPQIRPLDPTRKLAGEIWTFSGYVVDGRCRDTEFILEQGFRVFCNLNTPADIVARWMPERFGEPVTIGDVTICTGDYLLADRDGVVIIPGRIAADVVARTEQVLQTENKVRTAILGGMDPQEAYLKFGKF